MTNQMTITILGAGYVGLTTATLLANAGYTVYVIEPNKKRLDVIKQGKSFFYEEGIDALIKFAVDSGKLIPTDSYVDSVPKSKVIFSCVGTPDNIDGSSDLTYIFASAKEALLHMKPASIFVQKSTVPVGTGQKVEAIFAESDKSIAYVSNPEFLRESTAVYDSLYFDRIIAGGNDKNAVNTVLDIYRTLESHRDMVADLAGVKRSDQSGNYISTDLSSAELIKVTSNAFLAVKISFANSIARLADVVGADINEIMDGVGADPRIVRQFLNAGRGYGGGCLPKDVSGLIASGRENGVNLEMMTVAQTVNDSMPDYIIDKLEKKLNKELADTRIAVLGLSFKSGTSDVRKSAGIKIANTLAERGAIVNAYDPEALEEAKSMLNNKVFTYDLIKDALKQTDAVIIATDWPIIMQYDLSLLADQMDGGVFVDAVNRFDKQSVDAAGLTYIGIGR